MTANEDARVDLDAIEARYKELRRRSDLFPAFAMADLDALIAELRTLRASIGPDSERIRELEAENEASVARLQMAAEGRRVYAENAPDDLRRVLLTQAETLESAVRLLADKWVLRSFLPSRMWGRIEDVS
jgi:hypothetical protein